MRLGLWRTSLQQHADSAWVISQCGVVKCCATTETSPAAEPAAEFILSGDEDCRKGQRAIHVETRQIRTKRLYFQWAETHTHTVLGTWFIWWFILNLKLKFQSQKVGMTFNECSLKIDFTNYYISSKTERDNCPLRCNQYILGNKTEFDELTHNFNGNVWVWKKCIWSIQSMVRLLKS